jgi:hypothetical protein
MNSANEKAASATMSANRPKRRLSARHAYMAEVTPPLETLR